MHWILLAAFVGVSLVSVSLGDSGRKSYEGYQVLDVIPQNREQVEFLHKLMITEVDIDFWSEPTHVGKQVSIMVAPRRFHRIEVQLRKHGMNFEISNKNVQSFVNQEWQQLDNRRNAKGGMVFDIEDFNTIADINSWMNTLVGQCRTGLNCQVYSIGNSALGQPINVFRISAAGAGRKAYWLDAGIHAREWIAPATAIKVLDGLARGVDANSVRLANAYDWYILPVMNIDGYAYTFSSDRLWRKNRRQNTGSTCIGTDLNRNFNFRWGTEGVSHLPCSDTYCGPNGGSEPETQAVQNELLRLGPNVLASVTIHSYGNMWMFPWGNTVNHAGSTCERSSDHDELMRVSDLTANAIQAVYSTTWERGNSCEVIYTTTGGTDDYAKGVAGIKYAFCPELRGTNFVINKNQITPSYNEFWAGIVAMVDAING